MATFRPERQQIFDFKGDAYSISKLTPKRARRMAVAVSMTALTLSGAFASSAFGAGETFMDAQGLSAGNAYASYTARPYVNTTTLYSNHTACPAVASGYGGYTSTSFSGGHNTAYYDSECGYNYQSTTWNPVSGQLHGAVYNKNVSTYDFLNYAEYYW